MSGKRGKKPETRSSIDKSQSQTESEYDTEDQMENVDHSVSGIPSPGLQDTSSNLLDFTTSPASSKHQTSLAKSPASTSYSRHRDKNQSLSSNTSSTSSDVENSASPASKNTEFFVKSSPRQTRRATVTVTARPPIKQSLPSTGNDTIESTLESSPQKVVKVDNDVGQNSIPSYLFIAGIVVVIGLIVGLSQIFSNEPEASFNQFEKFVQNIDNFKSQFPAQETGLIVGLSQIFSNEPEASFNQFEKFVQNIDNFKSQFPAQETRFWRTVKASGKHVLNVTDPGYPAILLFVTKSKPANDDQFDVGSCLARKISAGFDIANMVKTSNSPIVDAGKLTTGSPQKQKMEFDDQLRSFLESNYKSVIVEHLELLTPSAALLLHGYCDNDNAPYKDVMIILVFHVENDNISPRAAEALLKQSWERDLETDKVDALMSRVANNIVIVHPESIASSSHCY